MPTTPTTPVAGSAVSQGPQSTISQVCQNAATADGNGTLAVTDGYNGNQILEIQKSGTGTTGVVLEGSFDSSTWYPCAYQQTDGITNLARAVATIALAAGIVNHVYQLLDTFPFVRARITGTAGAVSVLARLYGIPL
jgi:hypothetical protein